MRNRSSFSPCGRRCRREAKADEGSLSAETDPSSVSALLRRDHLLPQGEKGSRTRAPACASICVCQTTGTVIPGCAEGASRNDDGETHLRVPAAQRARVLREDLAPSKKSEGAGKAGCADRTRSLRANEKSTRASHHRYAETSGLPCAMVLRLMPCSPRCAWLFSHRRPRDCRKTSPT